MDKVDTESKPKVAEKSKGNYNNKVAIQSLFPAHLKYTGLVSGVKYEWLQAGDVVTVDESDVADLLSKRVGERGCCGNSPDGNIVFALLN